MPTGMGNFKGERGGPLYSDSAVNCAKTDEPIEMPFEIWTRGGPRKHAVATLRIPLNRPCAAAMRPVVDYFDHLL